MVLRLCTGRRTTKCCGTKVKIYKVVLIFQWRNARCTCNRTCVVCTTVPLLCTCHAQNGCTTVHVLQVEQCFSYVLAIHTEELQLSLALMEMHLSRCTVSAPCSVVIKNGF